MNRLADLIGWSVFLLVGLIAACLAAPVVMAAWHVVQQRVGGL